MTTTTRRAIILALMVAAIWFWTAMSPVPQPAGVLAPDPPQVTSIEGKALTFERNDHVLTALAGFRAKARILSTKRYGRDRDTRIAPLDLALGWGRLSDSATLKTMDIAQTERRVLFQSYDPALPETEVEAGLLNLHVIAADAETEQRLKDLRPGNIVRLEGWLVEATGSDGWRWKGEMRTRNPAAPGNVLWVQRIEIES